MANCRSSTNANSSAKISLSGPAHYRKKTEEIFYNGKNLFMGSILVKLALEGPSVDPEFLGRCGNIIVAVV